MRGVWSSDPLRSDAATPRSVLLPTRLPLRCPALPPQVTPITVGPLPAQFVRDIVATRSAMLAASGVENFDTWEDRSGRSAVSSSSGGGEQGSAGDKAAAGEAEAGACAGGGASGSKGLAPEAAAGVMQQHKSAVLSLLRQRLGRQPGGKPAGSAAKERAATPAPASEAGAPAEGPPPAEAIPCSTPQHAPGPVAASSYSSSSAGTPYTPYGTPLAILPHHPLHHPGTAAAAAGGGGSAEVPHRAGAGEAHPQLPGRGDQLVPPKQEGPVLVSAASQGEPGDGDLFQLD